MNSLAATLRRGTTPPTPGTPPPTEPPATVEAQLETLRTEIRNDREALANERRDTAIDTAIGSLQLDATRANLLRNTILQEHGRQISVDGKQVIHTDPVTGDKVSIGDFVAGLMKTPLGDHFRTAATPPSSPALRPKAPSTPAGTKTWSEMSQDERLKLHEEKPGEYYALLKAEMNSPKSRQ